jgi:hypothetical protein
MDNVVHNTLTIYNYFSISYLGDLMMDKIISRLIMLIAIIGLFVAPMLVQGGTIDNLKFNQDKDIDCWEIPIDTMPRLRCTTKNNARFEEWLTTLAQPNMWDEGEPLNFKEPIWQHEFSFCILGLPDDSAIKRTVLKSECYGYILRAQILYILERVTPKEFILENKK